ncbi:MAG: YihY/virulence factor BrkB family protein [Dehalogenimonas sp.]|uniref:YihY/virulence factor BrkB family protein n=1 Tax=Candidatus Dehalogenimonas loeffleri TaxID=3127115 RepID=A0ABZ2J2I4_9CHLR|nr:YihY/virulence factor BrkB family protein [Dehalogenimonas sp.]
MRNRINRIKDRFLSVRQFRVIVGTIEALGRDDASHLAAGVAYFAVLSLFPLLLGFISIAGIFLPSETVQQAIFEFMEQNLPIASEVIVENIDSIIASRGVIGVVSLLALFWTSSNMFTAIAVALNRSCGICERHPFYLRKPRDIALSLSAGFLFLFSGVLPTVISLIPSVKLPLFGDTASLILTLTGAGLSLLVFLVLYSFLPTHRNLWRFIWPGALLGTLLFELLRYGFIVFLSNFSNFQLVYGTIGSAIALMMWIYLSAFILLIGAEFNGQLKRLAEGTLNLDADKPI